MKYKAFYGEIRECESKISVKANHINMYTKDMTDSARMSVSPHIKVRDDLVNRSDENHNFLFVKFDGKQIPSQTFYLSSFLETRVARGDVTGIVKYAICNLIRIGANEHMIKQITEVGDGVFNQCIEEVINKYKDGYMDRNLNSKLRSLNIFDLL